MGVGRSGRGVGPVIVRAGPADRTRVDPHPYRRGSAIFLAEQAQALRENFLFPDPPDGLVSSLSRKKELHFLREEMDVPTPEASFPRSEDEVAAFAEAAVFPVVIKRIVNRLPEHRRQKSIVIDNSQEV